MGFFRNIFDHANEISNEKQKAGVLQSGNQENKS